VAHVADEAGFFVELGPSPVLTTAAQHTLDDVVEAEAQEPVVTASLHPAQPDDVAFTQAAARLHTAGAAVDWSGWFPADPAPRTVDLPTYAFQGRRFWLADILAPEAASPADGDEAGFWAAVEGEDVQALCDTLHLKDDERRSALETVFPALSAWRRERREQSVVDSWRYRVDWQPISLSEPTAPGAGPWLIVAPSQGADAWVRACLDALEEAGVPAVLVEAGPRPGRSDLAELLRSCRAGLPDGTAPAGVLSLLALAERPAEASLALLQALLDAGFDAPLWCATRGAVSCGETDPVVSPEQAAVWGLGRVAALEHPEVWGGLVDLPAAPEGREVGPLPAVLCGDAGEDQVALRPAGVLGRRLVPDAASAGGTGEGWRPDGAVLVTGGVGRLADHVVRWLAARGAEHVVLLDSDGAGGSRREAELAVEVAEYGSRLTVVRTPEEAAGARVRTVVHTSLPGVPAPLADVTPDDLTSAVSAAVALGEPAGAGPVETVLFFSSLAATLGSREHGAHAAANACLDALAQQHRPDGPRMVSVGWGIWDLPDDGDLALRQTGLSRRQGLPPLEPRLALGALHTLLDGGGGHAVVADVEWERFAPLFTLSRPTRLLDGVPAARRVLEAGPEAGDGADVAELRRELAALPARERVGALLKTVRAQVAAVLRYEPGQDVDPERAFKDLGFDSLVVVELRNRLRAATGLRLPATLVYDYPTPRALAEHLLERILPDGGAAELPVAAHLDELDAALADLAADDPRRRGLIRRLQALLWKHPDTAGPVASDGEDEAGGAEDLSAASADDMFALIDREWGGR
ncbi:beta-ketoacyl synthase, partial [Streptomyces mobaraensis NBRC 13819 = DSM 40847]